MFFINEFRVSFDISDLLKKVLFKPEKLMVIMCVDIDLLKLMAGIRSSSNLVTLNMWWPEPGLGWCLCRQRTNKTVVSGRSHSKHLSPS